MALPKGFKKNIDITPHKEGVERREQLLRNISEDGTFLPRGVMSRDMDKSFRDFVKKDLNPQLEGENTPTYFFILQRWSEFEQTWQNADQYKNMKIPFMTIIRNPNTEPGTNQAGLWNIPQGRTFTYMKVPTWDGNRRGVDVYKIPQPTSVDLVYQVRLFANKAKDINRFQEILQKTFQSRQHYIYVNGHPMPITLESIEDETRNEIEERRYFVIVCNMRLAGYLMDENDMEVIPAKNRALVFQELAGAELESPNITVETDIEADNISYNFVFKRFSKNTFSFNIDYDVEIYGTSVETNISSIEIKRNGSVVNFPFIAQAGDSIKVSITRNQLNKDSSFYLNGTIKS